VGQNSRACTIFGDTYNYNPGSFQKVSTLVVTKLIAKIGWNINDNHKLSVKTVM
jgi:hypothetical protein